MWLNKRVIFTIVAPLCVGAAIFGANARATPQTAVKLISMPSSWVSFDADYTSVDANKKVKLSGRYYRAADSSWRQDGRMADGTVTSQIFNMSARRSYLYEARENKWRVQPVVGEGFRLPTNVRESMQGLSRLDQPYEGLLVYENRAPSGGVTLDAPALNLFSVSRRWTDGGSFVFSNIQRRAQDAALFQLPPGVSVEQDTTPIHVGKVVARSDR